MGDGAEEDEGWCHLCDARCTSHTHTHAHAPLAPPAPHRYDGTVRNSAGDVVQFLYGEDGMDGVRIEGQVGEGVKHAVIQS